jgi:hypothetical protein
MEALIVVDSHEQSAGGTENGALGLAFEEQERILGAF